MMPRPPGLHTGADRCQISGINSRGQHVQAWITPKVISQAGVIKLIHALGAHLAFMNTAIFLYAAVCTDGEGQKAQQSQCRHFRSLICVNQWVTLLQ